MLGGGVRDIPGALWPGSLTYLVSSTSARPCPLWAKEDVRVFSDLHMDLHTCTWTLPHICTPYTNTHTQKHVGERTQLRIRESLGSFPMSRSQSHLLMLNLISPYLRANAGPVSSNPHLPFPCPGPFSFHRPQSLVLSPALSSSVWMSLFLPGLVGLRSS